METILTLSQNFNTIWPIKHWNRFNGNKNFKHICLQVVNEGVHLTLVLDLNSLALVGFDYSLKLVTFKLISTINILSIFCEIAIRWMPQHLTDH